MIARRILRGCRQVAPEVRPELCRAGQRHSANGKDSYHATPSSPPQVSRVKLRPNPHEGAKRFARHLFHNEKPRRPATEILPPVGRTDDVRIPTSAPSRTNPTGQTDQSPVSCVSYSHVLCTGRHDRVPRSLARDDPTHPRRPARLLAHLVVQSGGRTNGEIGKTSLPDGAAEARFSSAGFSTALGGREMERILSMRPCQSLPSEASESPPPAFHSGKPLRLGNCHFSDSGNKGRCPMFGSRTR